MSLFIDSFCRSWRHEGREKRCQAASAFSFPGDLFHGGGHNGIKQGLWRTNLNNKVVNILKPLAIDINFIIRS